MASGVTVNPLLQKIIKGHLECQICKECFKEPKMLECSHSFCLECLQQLVESESPSSQMLTCPVCRGQTLLTEKGVADLRTDFKSISLLDEIRQHETELQSQGSVSNCSKHTDKDLTLYCDTCKQFICITCITTDHRAHPATELNEVLVKCKKKANEVFVGVEQHHIIFKTVLQDIDMARKTLDSMFAATKAKISKRAEEEIAKEVARIREEEKILIVELEQIHKNRAKIMEIAGDENNKEITSAKNRFFLINQLMDTGSCCENLLLIQKLLQDLKEYTEIKPNIVPCELSFLDFEDDQKSLGKLRIKEEQKLEGATSAETTLPQKTWTLKTEITRYRKRDKQIQNICASDVASYSNSDVVVCDSRNHTLIKILADSNSQSKIIPKELSIKGLTNPISVTVNNNDELIVLDNKAVKIFNRKCKCLHQFTLVGCPDWPPSCIALDHNNLIAVGFVNQVEISLHKPDGSLISTLPAPGFGGYFTMYKQQLIYTNCEYKRLISLTCNGCIKFSVSIHKLMWPQGVCCDRDGRIYVAVWDTESSSGEIQQYSLNGEYTGCIIKGCPKPQGITLTPAGDLVVAAYESVQIYYHE